MRVKGTAVKSILDFVIMKYPDKVNEWLNELTHSSRLIIENPIHATDWYNIVDGVIEPTKALARVCFNGDGYKAGWESGRFSAEEGLKGVYKIFFRMATTKYIVERSAKILSVYYEPSEVKINDASDNHVHLTISVLPTIDPVLEARIAGWVQRALEVTGGRSAVDVDIPHSHTKGDKITEMFFRW